MALTKVGSAGVDHPSVALEEDLDAIKKTATETVDSSTSTTNTLNVQVPKVRRINGLPLTGDVELTDTVLDIYTKKVIDTKLAAIVSTAYNPVYLNGYLLDKDVTLTAGSVGSYSNAEIAAKRARFIPTTRKVANKALSANITVNAADVGAYTKTQIDAKMTGVLSTRTINTLPLAQDINLRAGDIGAPLAENVVLRTFKVNGVPLTGAGITLSWSSGSYTKAELDALLTGYIPVVNKWGLGTRAINQTSPESGFYSYTTGGPTGSSSGVKIVAGKGTLAFPSDLPGVWYSKDSVTFSRIQSSKVAPLPNYWAPLKDSLAIITGEGPRDTLTVNGSTVELTSRSVVFSRATAATYIDRNGVLKSAAPNEPRFEKDGLLIETQSTNFVQDSGKFGNAWEYNYWEEGSNNVPVVEQAGEGFFKVTTAEEYSNGVWIPSATIGLAPKKTYTLSFDIQVLSGVVLCGFEGSAAKRLILRPSDTPGMKRFTITWTMKAAVTNIIFYSGDPVSKADVVSEFILGRVQVEAGSVASSYIPTTGVAATRAGDLAYIPESLNIPTRSGALPSLTTAVNVGRWVTESANPVILSGTNFGYVGIGENYVSYKAYSYYGVGFTSVGRPTGLLALRIDTEKNVASSIIDGKFYSQPVTKENAYINIYNFRLSTTMGTSDNNINVMHLSNLRLWHRALTDEQMRGLS